MARVVDRLSPQDALYLWVRRPDWSIVGWAAVVDGARLRAGDGALDLDGLRARLAQRLLAVPRLRQRVVVPRWGLGLPWWEDDLAFDLDHHVTALTCRPPGGHRELLDCVEQIFARPFPMDRPLWDLTVVSGLAGGDVALVQRVHHALADGMAVAAIVAALAGDGPPPPPHRAQPAPTGVALWADAVRFRGGAWLRAVATLRHPGRVLRTARELVSELRDIAAQDAAAARTSFNVPVGSDRRLDVVTVPLAAVRDAAHAHGASVNDVLLAAVAGGLRALLEGRGEPNRVELFASVPVAARTVAQARRPGNATGGMRVPLHVDEAEDQRRVEAIASDTRRLKALHRDPAVLGLVASPLVPRALPRNVDRIMRRQRLIHAYITNLKGPPEPMRLLGATAHWVVPVVPVLANIPLGVCAVSYAGDLSIAVRTDPAVLRDHATLLAGIRSSLERLLATAPVAATKGSQP